MPQLCPDRVAVLEPNACRFQTTQKNTTCVPRAPTTEEPPFVLVSGSFKYLDAPHHFVTIN